MQTKLQIECKKQNFSEKFAEEEIDSDFSENDGGVLPISSKKTEGKLNRFEKHIVREKQEEKEYYIEIKKNRIEQLKQQNEDEDKIIGKYEKLLKLNRRKKEKSSTSSAKFNDGLEYLLELCTDESIHKMYTAAKEIERDQSKDENEIPQKNKRSNNIVSEDSKKSVEEIDMLKKHAAKMKGVEMTYFDDDEDFFSNYIEDSCEGSDNEESADDEIQFNCEETTNIKTKFCLQNKLSDSDDSDELDESGEDNLDDFEDSNRNHDKSNEWEDIYGRSRDDAENPIRKDKNKYIISRLRNTLNPIDAEEDPKRREKLQNLKRQIKGLVNRLAESNLHRIAIEIENLYSSNVRHDINSILTEAIINALVSNVISVERIVLEHTLLIATLHANIGSEIGSFFLQIVVEKFDSLFTINKELKVDNKELDNVIFIICHLYTYRIFKHTLIYEMLNKLCEVITEKGIECVLLVLRSIGFVLRKDDPLMLKEFIIKVQKLANTMNNYHAENSRVIFMLEILMAVKNNNVSKIPQYDSTLVEYFRKMLKQFVRPGNHVTTLAITMEDLLKADERGKWWLVGSAWAGDEKIQSKKAFQQESDSDEQRQKIFALAKKQRMNTDDKRDIFYILMTAEDYLDAFEKIVSSVKDERSIISVVIHCCLSEKVYNPFYSVIAQKFCEYNRKYLLAIQFTIWDKIKDINNLHVAQVSNLSRFSSFLIENGNLSLSVLKVIEFNQIEKGILQFLRQIIMQLLLLPEEKFLRIFERIAPSVKLNSFKDQLRLFMKVFLLDNEKQVDNSNKHFMKLKERMAQVDKFLIVKHF